MSRLIPCTKCRNKRFECLYAINHRTGKKDEVCNQCKFSAFNVGIMECQEKWDLVLANWYLKRPLVKCR